MKYDEEGNLVISDKLGYAIVADDFWEFERAVKANKSDDLSYQDLMDFSMFSQAYRALGSFLGAPFEEYEYGQVMMAVIQRADGATFGFDYWKQGGKYGEADYGPDEDGDWVFVPVEPFTITGYTAAP